MVLNQKLIRAIQRNSRKSQLNGNSFCNTSHNYMDNPDCQGLLVLPALLANQDLVVAIQLLKLFLVLLGHQVQQDIQDRWDLQVHPVSQVIQVLLVQSAPVVHLDMLVLLVWLDTLVRMDLLEPQDIPELQVNQDSMELLVRTATQEDLDLRD